MLRLTTTGAARSVLLQFEAKYGRPGNGKQAWLTLQSKYQNNSRQRRRTLLRRLDNSVVVDPYIQRIVLATEETTVTQQVSHRPIKCQSRLWLQRGTKVNGSHHGDNPLLRPTGIQIATKSYAALQAMAPTNIKTVHQTSLLHIESNLDRLGMLSPTHDQRSQQKPGTITLQPVLINKSKFLKATHCTGGIRKNEIPRSIVVEALS